MLNRPFPSCLLAVSQNECSCEITHIKNDFRVQVPFHANQTHFHKKAFVERLRVLRHRVTWKWPIVCALALSFGSSQKQVIKK